MRVSERTRKYVSISIGGATQPLGLRWGFENSFTDIKIYGPQVK